MGRPGGTWAAIEIPGYRRLFLSAAVVIFGTMGQAVARGWLARELTGSNVGLGGVMLVFGAAMLVATPFGGVAADRYPKRTVLLVAVLALTSSSVAIGVAVVTGVIEYWMLLVASGVQAVAFAYYLPARISFIAELVPSAMLSNAVVVAQMAQEAARVIAPALAGVMLGVSWFGVGGVFLAAGAAGAISLPLLVRLPAGAARALADRSPLGEAVDALRYARATSGLGAIALFTVGVVMVGFPYLTFLPTLADDRYDVGAVGFGAMSAIAGLGALLAGVLNTRTSSSNRPWMTIAVAAGTFGLGAIALGIAPTFATALVALVVLGGAGLIFQTASQALMLKLSAFEYHGRMQSFVIIGFSGFGLAALPLGLLADATSVDLTLVAMGMCVLAMTVVFAAARWSLRRRLVPGDFG
ncbi:MAG TPA: MFS transporter [Ilumatobacter sp.]|nr:MFS transporter [Ilumatobacter sp.]